MGSTHTCASHHSHQPQTLSLPLSQELRHHSTSQVRVACQGCTSLWVGQGVANNTTKYLNNTRSQLLATTQEQGAQQGEVTSSTAQIISYGQADNQGTQGLPTVVSQAVGIMEEADNLQAQVVDTPVNKSLGMADKAHREESVAILPLRVW